MRHREVDWELYFFFDPWLATARIRQPKPAKEVPWVRKEGESILESSVPGSSQSRPNSSG